MKGSLCVRIVSLILSVCVLCSGCSMIGADVENQLIPPQNDVEQNAMQNALNAQLQTQNFVLTYPTGGDYRTPFVVLNQIRKPEVITPTPTVPEKTESNILDGWGLVFYRYTTGNAKTRIHVLRKDEEGVWNTVADIEGFGTEIGDVNFADLTGDGFPELLLGWTLYGTVEKRLEIYRIDKQLETIACDVTYAFLTTADLTSDGAEDIVLMHPHNGEQRVEVQLLTAHERELRFRGKTKLDKGVAQVSHVLRAALSPTVTGLYMDCKKDCDTTITELVYWNGTSLESPFSDDVTDTNTMTSRNGKLFCRDIDGDGEVEWPISREDGLTDWVSYDFRAGESITKFSSVVNIEDGYLIRLRPEWQDPETTSISFIPEERVIYLEDKGTEQRFLEIMTVSADEKFDLPEGYRYIGEKQKKKYAVRVDSDIITLEEAQYVFVAL